MAIKLSPETTKQLHASIKRYFAEKLDQDIGDLKAGMLLDYGVKEIGPTRRPNKRVKPADGGSDGAGRVRKLHLRAAEGLCFLLLA